MTDTAPTRTPVEQKALETSPFDMQYAPTEKIPTLVVENFPVLGKLAALRFVEWVQANPGGVISLPTGKTPEHFIRWVQFLLETWDQAKTREQLVAGGIDPAIRPDMKSLHFVQIDEFYPIQPTQKNSFYSYVNEYYLQGFALDPAKAILMDCSKIGLAADQTLEDMWPRGEVDLSLRHRQAHTDRQRSQAALLARIDQWCQAYEQRIRALGGIGFFLGGIGPDGHIGFNMRGSDHFSTTRLTVTNYETQAAAAGDLGGIEVARKRLVITIGLGTLTYNPNCTAIVIAAGAAKAPMVAAAVQDEPNVLVPGTALHGLPNARFYVTQGAAGGLTERMHELLVRAETVADEDVEKVLVDLAVAKNKRLVDLTESDLASDRFASTVLSRREEPAEALAAMVRDRLIAKVEAGSRPQVGRTYFHTEPHHDDIMLGYLPAVVRHGRSAENTHYFATLTSGFTAVTNAYLKNLCTTLRRFLGTAEFEQMLAEGYFLPGNQQARQRDVWQYLDGVAEDNQRSRDEGTSRRFLRDLVEVYEDRDVESIGHRLFELEHYLDTMYPGRKDHPHIQRLKGMCREWEAECLWGYFGWNCSHVRHLRLGFYTGDIFTEEPTVERDVPPVREQLDEIQPDVVTVALDPEASGPDTHYKVMQAISAGLKQYAENTGRDDIRVWGYRNVWYRFHPSEANVFVPVSLNMFSIMSSAFVNTFGSQREASFPSYEHDGPFCELAQQIQVEQYRKIKICLGREWFYEHPSALIRATRGLVFLRDLSLGEFAQLSRELRRRTDGV